MELVEFTAQEVRNILRGIDRQSEELEVLGTSYTLYVIRDLTEKTFTIYGDRDVDQLEPLYQLNPENEAEFGFFNRYYMLRSNEFDFDGPDEPTDVPGVGGPGQKSS